MRINSSFSEIKQALYRAEVNPQKRRSVLGELKSPIGGYNGAPKALVRLGIGRIYRISSGCDCCEDEFVYSVE